PGISSETRAKMSHFAVQAAKAAGYVNAGTIEYLVDDNQNFYFMEMNTRLQVEHAVTEMVTGIDLVKWQIRIAAGLPLNFEQKDVTVSGSAIEC
ncbi:acetyl/propionyl-CoA carboxylase subunit alpha, partial [Mycobacteroides abscessus subsp. massiliense]